jgi:hypothetical protein
VAGGAQFVLDDGAELAVRAGECEFHETQSAAYELVTTRPSGRASGSEPEEWTP